jgi:hypothetical protein
MYSGKEFAVGRAYSLTIFPLVGNNMKILLPMPSVPKITVWPETVVAASPRGCEFAVGIAHS